jgi:RNA polymerase sigma factor (sigma-70 family)
MESHEAFHELMENIKAGSEDAAWELVREYGENIRRAVRRALDGRLRSKFDSMDFVQLVWSSFFHKRRELDHFQQPEKLVAYLAAMARNKVGMEVRRRLMTEKRNVRRECSLDQLQATDNTEMGTAQSVPIDIAIAREQWDRMLENETPLHRQIIHLRLQGHTYQAIADIVHLDERTVRRFVRKLSRTITV